MFETAFSPEIRVFYDRLEPHEQAQLDQIVRLLELNPWSDSPSKTTVNMGRWAAGVYDDGRWEVVYRVVDDRFIKIVGIGRIGG